MVVQQPSAGMQQGSQAGSDRARAQQLQAALKAAAEATRPVARRKSGPPLTPEQAWPKQGARLLAGQDRAWHSGTVNRVEITHGAKALLHVDYDGALPRLPLDLKAADTYHVPPAESDDRDMAGRKRGGVRSGGPPMPSANTPFTVDPSRPSVTRRRSSTGAVPLAE